MDHLWQVLLRVATAEEETLSCEDCAILIDYLADLLANGHAPAEILPLAGRYLERCPDCHHEYQRTLEELFLASQG